MSRTNDTWVVYLMTVHGKHAPICAVCEQAEWDAMELARPGYHTLIRSGIANESEAEKIARDRAIVTPTAGHRPR